MHHPHSNTCALVIDGSKHVTGAIKTHLVNSGWKCVYAAGSLKGAVDIVENEIDSMANLSLVVASFPTDMTDEEELSSYIQSVNQAFPKSAIIVLGDGIQKEFMAAIKAGAHSYLIRPFSFEEFDRHVRLSLQKTKHVKMALKNYVHSDSKHHERKIDYG